MPPTNSVLLSEAVVERMPFLRNASVRFFDFGNVQILEHSTAGEHTANTASQHGGKSSFAAVVVITDEVIAIASFPTGTAAPIVVPHSSIVGVARDGQSVILRNSFMNDLKATLPKCDAFVVHLIGIQDRSMNRTLRLAGDGTGAGSGGAGAGSAGDVAGGGGGGGAAAGGVGAGSGAFGSSANPAVVGGAAANDPNAVRRAMSLAENIKTQGDASDASMERLWGVIRLGRGSSRAGPPTTELDEGSDASSVQTIRHVADSPREDLDVVDNDEEQAPVEEAEVPPMVTDAASLKRRLWYFFMYYDQSRLQYIDTLCSMHSGTDGKALMKELESQYGPEPHRFRWSIRDQTIYQREINSQLTAQLARAQDELLLLKENPHEREVAVHRVLQRKEEIVAQMLSDTSPQMHSLGSQPLPGRVPLSPGGGQQQQHGSGDNAAWQEMFLATAGGGSSSSSNCSDNSKIYHVVSFHDVTDASQRCQPPPSMSNNRANIEWTVIIQAPFWSTVKQQVIAMGQVRTTRPLLEVTDEDAREMLVCNRDFFLAWLAESHGECILHLRHTDGTFCFMALSEAFPHVHVGL